MIDSICGFDVRQWLKFDGSFKVSYFNCYFYIWCLVNDCVCVCVSVPIGFYGLQHYLSMLGSLILVPLVIVPAMGGSHVSVILLELWSVMIAFNFIFFDHLIFWIIGGYCKCCIDCTFCLWNHYTVAYFVWVEASFDSRTFLCFSCSGFGYNKLSGVSRFEWK